jgi:hypothetical protein
MIDQDLLFLAFENQNAVSKVTELKRKYQPPPTKLTQTTASVMDFAVVEGGVKSSRSQQTAYSRGLLGRCISGVSSLVVHDKYRTVLIAFDPRSCPGK